jgi:hypothetical protein
VGQFSPGVDKETPLESTFADEVLAPDEDADREVAADARENADAAMKCFRSVYLARHPEVGDLAQKKADAAYDEWFLESKTRYITEHPEIDADAVFGARGAEAAQNNQAAYVADRAAEFALLQARSQIRRAAISAGASACAVAAIVADLNEPREIWERSLQILNQLICLEPVQTKAPG